MSAYKYGVKALGCSLLALGILLGSSSPPAYAQDTWTRHTHIAHGMGQIDGVNTANAGEAFVLNYDKGFRVFEADLILTTDGHLVARHDWSDYLSRMLQQTVASEQTVNAPMSLAQFKERNILGAYRPLEVSELLNLLVAYPDAYLVTDTKETDPQIVDKQFRLLVEAAKAIDPALLERIIPELYTPEMIRQVRDIYPFPSYLFSLYLSSLSHEEVLEEVRTLGIQAVAMPLERVDANWMRQLKAEGAVVYTHTLNDPLEWARLQKMGVHGVYTDELLPSSRRTAVSFPGEDGLTETRTVMTAAPAPLQPAAEFAPLPSSEPGDSRISWFLERMKLWLGPGSSA
ncbi:glycerophosphoryl diester phosphodiesterase [Paenibacillus sp. UNCCL117]|uniref:phosphatidylinositol-specific phospholipase C/glycerophosphodiester phosphodiesterase family protein n=1 Tax=unclassified Paenibacillus TaxID=185978 RepID=UPI00088E1E44|nr:MULTISPECIES: phosphatidylinositol-specific phospholipase C/glycerophosphodiester phosphodiesterase family protein [unclassified Paenibacillus]SDC76632.1 glycerophosphoryl diester phosphodiesterase [Paenibacillus sp. cl123]SFW25641.1 glycerophosphoryl diester phosphodiesterase [Paenibacillus sp. UNCCL117]